MANSTSKASVKKLTAAQKDALAELKSFITSNQSFFRLSGYAGTGKSFLICRLNRMVKLAKARVCCGCTYQ